MAGAIATTTKSRFADARIRGNIFQYGALLLCIAFGIALILNTQPAGDGVWFWYATFLHGGKHLYADMHLALQPVFVLETAYAMSLLGKSWMASKVPAVVHLVAYCVALLLLVRQSRLSDIQKSIVFAAAFFVSISFEAYRFDDYHVLADCFQLYSVLGLLKLRETERTGQILGSVAVLGVLSGLAITTRLNDGGALAVGVAIGIVCLVPSKRFVSLLFFSVVTVIAALIVVKLTGDTVHDWAYYSILHAAASKGGAGNVLTYPLMLPLNVWRFLSVKGWQQLLIDGTGAALAWGFLVAPLKHGTGKLRWTKAAVGALLIVLLIHIIWAEFYGIEVIMSFSSVGVLMLYLFGVLAVVRFLRDLLPGWSTSAWNRNEILLLIPLGQLASGSMSSGGVHSGLYGPIGVLIALLPIASPILVESESFQSCLLAVAVLLMANGAIYRIRTPYSWHTYHAKRLFSDRVLYRHPLYGPMLIDRGLLAMIQPVCDRIRPDDTGPPELLSLPFPFANYFCGVSPWRGYVQTFFDTSSKETIETLMDRLEESPPRWIFYQRQLAVLAIHEKMYNQDKPLQHRFLDQMIEQKLGQRDWHAVYRNLYENKEGLDSEWILIDTHNEQGAVAPGSIGMDPQLKTSHR